MADGPLPLTSSAGALTASVGLGTAEGKSPEQLRALAAQFESMLMSQLLREMQQSMFGREDEGGAEVGMGAGPLADAVFAEFSVALSRAGGLGLSAALMEPLARQAGLASGGDVRGMTAPAAEMDGAGPAAVVPAVAADPASYASMPGRLTSGYGWRRDPIDGALRFHRGLDVAMRVGEEVPAARHGEVEFAGELPGFGLTVVVKHDDRISTRYAHLSEILVNPGETVAAGATIARSGATGRATGPHLHVEMLENGRPVDPAAIKVLRRTAD